MEEIGITSNYTGEEVKKKLFEIRYDESQCDVDESSVLTRLTETEVYTEESNVTVTEIEVIPPTAVNFIITGEGGNPVKGHIFKAGDEFAIQPEEPHYGDSIYGLTALGDIHSLRCDHNINHRYFHDAKMDIERMKDRHQIKTS